MYANVHESRSAMRTTGVITAVLVTLAVGYMFSEGLHPDFVPSIERRSELVMIAPKEDPLPLPVKKEEPVEKVKNEKPELVAPDIPVIPVEPVITAPPAPATPAPITAPGAGSDRIPPKLRPGDKPDYPAASLRASEQGTTHLEVCVSDKGRVQSVTIVGSSGFPRLDDAAAKWLRNERFTPGSVGGVPQPMCGHDVYYQWNLEDA